MPQLAFGRLRSVFDLGQQRWFDPDTAVGDLLGVGCVFRISGFNRACSSLVEASSKPWSTLPA
jgi:hypothetical protein